MDNDTKFKEAGFFQRNLKLKLFSLFVALILWLYVHSTDLPLRVVSMETDIKVPISYSNIPKDFLITNAPSQAIITVRGNKEQIETLLPTHLKASINQLISYSGTYSDVALQVDKPQGITVLKVSPDKISFSVDRFTEKEVKKNGAFIRH